MSISLTGKHVRKTAIFRALQLGDMLCVIPAVRAFKKFYPESEITLIGLPWAKDFVRRFRRYFSSFIAFPGYPGLVEQSFSAEGFDKFLSAANHKEFDFFIQMHGNGSVTNKIAEKLKSKIKSGYFEEYGKPPDENLFMQYPEELPEVERHLRLMEFIGVPLQGSELEFPVYKNERKLFGKLSEEFELRPKEYVCIHPGARDERRRWSPDRFALIADTIMNNGCQVVLTGAASEAGVVSEVERIMRHPAVNLAGKTGLGVLAELIRNSRLLICNDTGVSHVAAAVNAPSIVIFLESDPRRWAPLNRELHHVILPDETKNIDGILRYVGRKLLDRNFDGKSLKVA